MFMDLITMKKLKGITVTLISYEETGERDAFNHPITSEVREDVENVLVAPVSSSDIENNTSLDGHIAIYTLGIPKEDNHSWSDKIVEIWGRKWHTIGLEIRGIDELIPTDWNKKITIEAYE